MLGRVDISVCIYVYIVCYCKSFFSICFLSSFLVEGLVGRGGSNDNLHTFLVKKNNINVRSKKVSG